MGNRTTCNWASRNSSQTTLQTWPDEETSVLTTEPWTWLPAHNCTRYCHQHQCHCVCVEVTHTAIAHPDAGCIFLSSSLTNIPHGACSLVSSPVPPSFPNFFWDEISCHSVLPQTHYVIKDCHELTILLWVRSNKCFGQILLALVIFFSSVGISTFPISKWLGALPCGSFHATASSVSLEAFVIRSQGYSVCYLVSN